MKTKRLEILENSLKKKEILFEQKLNAHFEDVKSTNGQPLNDKRNGAATLKRWERQDNTLRALNNSIEKTKRAIEKEKGKIILVKSVELPKEIKKLLKEKKITQWRKYPNRFFVVGVEKARLILDEKTNKIKHSYVSNIPTKEQYAIFRDIFNELNNTLNKK
jgi:predicted Rossmann fold nucleotide-binding protein DprA/Smf involved in DNA uptake